MRAQRTSPVGDKDVKWLARERTTGTYARQLTLGNRVALDRIRADYEDGVLTLTIPVAEEARPRKISVQHQAPKQTEVVESTEVIETDDEQRL
ncbi:molecular chaperone [Mycobacteroides abscessus subsp. abscessus]|nr:molecular chaperone [Mycobacteroides abscessus subsp. abscessus]